jgi:hypothetical protein
MATQAEVVKEEAPAKGVGIIVPRKRRYMGLFWMTMMTIAMAGGRIEAGSEMVGGGEVAQSRLCLKVVCK